MTRHYKNLTSAAVGILYLLLFAACSGVQGPEITQQATATKMEVTVPAITLEPPTATIAPSTAPLEPRTVSLTPAGPTPTPDLGMMTVDVRTSTSPDGQWKAEALLANPYSREGDYIGERDYARLTVYRIDGSQKWTPYEEWSETGLGDSYLSEFYWPADGRFLYFTHSGYADGCGGPFVTHLRRVDLREGSLSEIPLTGLGLDVLTISPEGDRMAYRTEDGMLVYDLESGNTSTLPYPWPAGFDYLVGWYAWSPDGTALAFTIQENFCGPLEDIRTSIRMIELDSGGVRDLTSDDPRALLVTDWPEPNKLQVDQDGKRYFLDLDSGSLLPDNTPTDSVSVATRILQDYLDSLYWRGFDPWGFFTYERAADLYAGSYETLVEMNPGVDPSDHATLLRNACKVNGFQCLRLREVLSSEVTVGENGGREFRFTVQLQNPDGSTFALGPCCDEEASGEPQTEFIFTVKQMEGGVFKVLELPPYMP